MYWRLLWRGWQVLGLVKDVVMARSVKQPNHGEETIEVHRLRYCVRVNLVADGTVQVKDFKANACWLDESFRERGDGHVVYFTDGSLDVLRAVTLHVGLKVVLILFRSRLDPGTGEELLRSVQSKRGPGLVRTFTYVMMARETCV
jgi:hypothetical protein